jgi:hypothetical protein
MTNLVQLLDDYALRARLYPGLLASLPILTTILLLWPHLGLKAIWSAIITAGGAFFLANYVRSRGKHLEATLIKDWNGMPTTHMLRYSEISNPTMFRRRRQALESLFGESLPTREEEQADPAVADERYVAATRFLISKVRDDKQRYPRIHEENIHYGFRRNLLALKPEALIAICVMVIAAAVAAVIRLSTEDFAALGIDAVLALAWLAVVKPSWVYEAGWTYAERLFEAPDTSPST